MHFFNYTRISHLGTGLGSTKNRETGPGIVDVETVVLLHKSKIIQNLLTRHSSTSLFLVNIGQLFLLVFVPLVSLVFSVRSNPAVEKLQGFCLQLPNRATVGLFLNTSLSSKNGRYRSLHYGTNEEETVMLLRNSSRSDAIILGSSSALNISLHQLSTEQRKLTLLPTQYYQSKFYIMLNFFVVILYRKWEFLRRFGFRYSNSGS